MKHDPLTDPTSLITYRLANRATAPSGARREPRVPISVPAPLATLLGLGVLAVVVLGMALLR